MRWVAAGWRTDLRVAWRALWVSRLVVWGAGVLAMLVFGISERAADFDPTGVTSPWGEPWDTLVGPAARWDTVWFLGIAQSGYDDGPRAAFFPLYPLLVDAGSWLFSERLFAAVLVAWVCALLGLAVVHRLATIEVGAEGARWTVWSLALFPASLFLTAAYSESLFLLLSAGALLCARTEHWAWAGVLGALAAATRSAGLVLVVPLALLWWDARRRGRAPSLLDLGLATALVPLGVLAFCGFLALDGHDAAAPFNAQETWFREFAGPFVGAWDGLVAAIDGARQLLSGSREPVYFEPAGGDPFAVAGHNLKNLAFLVLFAVPATVAALRRLPLAYGAYAVAALALPLSYPVAPQPLMSLPRFVAVLVPLFLVTGAWLARTTPARRRATLTAFTLGLALFSGQFACWKFVA